MALNSRLFQRQRTVTKFGATFFKLLHKFPPLFLQSFLRTFRMRNTLIRDIMHVFLALLLFSFSSLGAEVEKISYIKTFQFVFVEVQVAVTNQTFHHLQI